MPAPRGKRPRSRPGASPTPRRGAGRPRAPLDRAVATGSPGRSRRHVDPREVVVHDVASGAGDEVRRDETLGAREEPLAPRHRPDHRAVYPARDGARPDAAPPDRDEPDLARPAIADGAVLDEAAVGEALHPRLEHRALSVERLDGALDAAVAEHRPNRLA